MKRLIPVLLAAASTFAISACAFNSPGEKLRQQADASEALSRGHDQDESVRDMHLEVLAGARGDWSASRELGELSYSERPDIWNEFNLATAYEHTGRTSQAVPLYTDLVERGRSVALVPVQNFDGSWPQAMAPTVSEESARRLDWIAGRSPRPYAASNGYPILHVSEVRQPNIVVGSR